MTSTSTHDTKRSEDVRARLAVLSEIPDLWQKKVTAWARANQGRKNKAEDELMPDLNDEYLIYQTIVGVCPLELLRAESQSDKLTVFRDRINKYILKAARESKMHTSWINPDAEYEEALASFVDRILTPSTTNTFFDDCLQFTASLAQFGLINSLTQALLKFCSPGVPDIYQGCELWDFSLVDPDNRRPVDFKHRINLLNSLSMHDKNLDGEGLFEHLAIESREKLLNEITSDLSDGRAKLLLTATCLQLRQTYPALFTKGRYIPLETSAQEHVIAFAREFENQWSVVIAPLLSAELLAKSNGECFYQAQPALGLKRSETWSDVTVTLPRELQEAKLTNIFTLKEMSITSTTLHCRDVFKQFPVAVLHGSKADAR